MISKSSLDIRWIEKVSAEKKNSDKILVEKVIRALLLVEGLAKYELDFIFKGGTALMLLTDSAKRLSIDIDIIIQDQQPVVSQIFDRIVKNQFFNKFEIQNRDNNSNIEKAHYKFFYDPVHKTHGGSEYIVLDILTEKKNYTKINNYPISSDFCINEGEKINVSIPSVEDFLGDKLTAFAPNTTGIPYFKKSKSCSMEMIKQLYDIGILFDLSENLDIIKTTFKKIAETELRYRNLLHIDHNDVIEDIFQTSLCLSSKGKLGDGNFEEILNGIKRISGFIFSEKYHLEKAIISASKAAYIAMLIKYQKNVIEKYDNPLQMTEWKITNLWPKINRMKRFNPEAYYYWYKISKII